MPWQLRQHGFALGAVTPVVNHIADVVPPCDSRLIALRLGRAFSSPRQAFKLALQFTRSSCAGHYVNHAAAVYRNSGVAAQGSRTQTCAPRQARGTQITIHATVLPLRLRGLREWHTPDQRCDCCLNRCGVNGETCVSKNYLFTAEVSSRYA